jgi:hypothetical protein
VRHAAHCAATAPDVDAAGNAVYRPLAISAPAEPTKESTKSELVCTRSPTLARIARSLQTTILSAHRNSRALMGTSPHHVDLSIQLEGRTLLTAPALPSVRRALEPRNPVMQPQPREADAMVTDRPKGARLDLDGCTLSIRSGLASKLPLVDAEHAGHHSARCADSTSCEHASVRRPFSASTAAHKASTRRPFSASASSSASANLRQTTELEVRCVAVMPRQPPSEVDRPPVHAHSTPLDGAHDPANVSSSIIRDASTCNGEYTVFGMRMSNTATCNANPSDVAAAITSGIAADDGSSVQKVVVRMPPTLPDLPVSPISPMKGRSLADPAPD